MKVKKPLVAPKMMVAIGLLMISGSFIIRGFFPSMDFVSGFIMGFGLIIEVMGFIKLKREKASA